MMTTVRALGSCVKTLAVGVTVALLGLTVWPVTGRLGVTRAAGLPGAESDAHLVAQGERLFALDFTPERGLGPLFNGTSCLTCHNTQGKENAMRTQTIIHSLPGHGYVWLTQHAPGIAVATLVGLSAWALQRLEVWLMGQAVLEAMVFALLLGMLWRNLVGVCSLYRPGIVFTGKQILEGTVVLLGASIDLSTLLKAGPQLLLAIVAHCLLRS
jgi:hypothetical protein